MELYACFDLAARDVPRQKDQLSVLTQFAQFREGGIAHVEPRD